MASLVGHELAALAAWEAGRQAGWAPRGRALYLLPAALAAAPDLDVLAGIISGQVAHRGPSHSLVFALGMAGLSALALAVLQRGREKKIEPLRLLAVLSACCCLHPLLDILMARGPGVPLLWPFSDLGLLSPVQLVPTAYYARSLSGLLGVALSGRTWAGVGLELLSLGALWPTAWALGQGRRRLAAACVVLSAAGFVITYQLYN
ncbi:MAG: metal-dependent hydrolase [Deltaproteobacteria bacterium]|nr:metal-dependent hydrolase [Deltaproteobacteria bacterium]